MTAPPTHSHFYRASPACVSGRAREDDYLMTGKAGMPNALHMGAFARRVRQMSGHVRNPAMPENAMPAGAFGTPTPDAIEIAFRFPLAATCHAIQRCLAHAKQLGSFPAREMGEEPCFA